MVDCPKGCGDFKDLHTHWRLSHFEPFPDDLPKMDEASRRDYAGDHVKRSGSSHPAWKDKNYSKTRKFRRLRPEIRKRDGYRCQFCSIHSRWLPQKLHVHHVDGQADERDNLLSLCFWCHYSLHGQW